MAKADSVDMCMKCALAVDMGILCPECGDGLTRLDSRAFQAVLIIRRRGWKPVKVKSKGIGKEKVVVVLFDGYSPGCGIHGEMKTRLEHGKAACVTIPWRSSSRFKNLLEWAEEVREPPSRVPFNRELCEKCHGQSDAKWLHGICDCPRAGLLDDEEAVGTIPREFGKGIPRNCLYIVEQTVTRDDVKEMFLQIMS